MTIPIEQVQVPDFSKPIIHQQHFELYRLRFEYFERNFYSLRTVEWQVAFQIYAGYAAVAGGFFALKSHKDFTLGEPTLAIISILLLILLLVVGTFWQYQILVRLHYCQNMQFAYLDSLHKAVAPHLSPTDGAVMPRYRRWWAFRPMMAINVATFLAIAASICVTTAWCRCH